MDVMYGYLLSFDLPASGAAPRYGSASWVSRGSDPAMVRPENSRPPVRDRRSCWCAVTWLDRVADRAPDLPYPALHEAEGDDRDDGDEGEDQGVLGEALAVLA